MKSLLLASAISLVGAAVVAEPVTYKLDPPHSQVVFTWNHFGFSRTMAMFSGIEGELIFDQENPENSSVTATIPVSSVFTGHPRRDNTFQSEEFFNAETYPDITFTSTNIVVTGVDTGNITGDLTARGITVPVTLHTRFNGEGENPVYKTPAVGFTATATLLRSDFEINRLIPMMGDEIELLIQAEGIVPKPE